MKRVCLLLAFGAALQAQTPAEDLIEAGHWKRARAIVDAKLRESPNDPLANFLESQVAAAFGGRETPLSFAEKAVSLDDRVARFHRQIAEVTGIMAQRSNMVQQLFLARRFTKEMNRALQLDPRDIQALRDQMEYYILAPGVVGGDKTQARSVAARIAKIDPCEGLAAEARLADFSKDSARAADLLRKAAVACPGKYKIRIALARVYQARAEWDQAASVARDAINLDATRADAYSILADALARKGDLDALAALLDQADRAVPDDLTPHYRAAEALLSAGREMEAVRQFQIYLSQEPEGGAPPAADARRVLANLKPKTKVEGHVPN